MQVNLPEAKDQLSLLVQRALDGDDVVIASDGEPMVKLVPVKEKLRLRGWGKLSQFQNSIDAAFNVDLDSEIARSLSSSS